jgi:hypothetical protein
MRDPHLFGAAAQMPAADAAIQAALEQSVRIDWHNVACATALAGLLQQHGIERFDLSRVIHGDTVTEDTLQQIGELSPNAASTPPVPAISSALADEGSPRLTVKLADVPLRTALTLILRQLDGNWQLDRGVIVVTWEKAWEFRRVRGYRRPPLEPNGARSPLAERLPEGDGSETDVPQGLLVWAWPEGHQRVAALLDAQEALLGGQGPDVVYADSSAATAAVREALDRPVEFAEPLPEVLSLGEWLDTLARAAGLEGRIVASFGRAHDGASQRESRLVRAPQIGETPRQALRRALNGICTWTVEDGLLLVGDALCMDRHFETRWYRWSPPEALAGTSAKHWESVIRRCVAPGKWYERSIVIPRVAGDVYVLSGVLAVVQTEDVHEELERFLAALAAGEAATLQRVKQALDEIQSEAE